MRSMAMPAFSLEAPQVDHPPGVMRDLYFVWCAGLVPGKCILQPWLKLNGWISGKWLPEERRCFCVEDDAEQQCCSRARLWVATRMSKKVFGKWSWERVKVTGTLQVVKRFFFFFKHSLCCWVSLDLGILGKGLKIQTCVPHFVAGHIP